MISIETMEEERQLFNILSNELPQTVKEKILQVIEQYEEKRSI